MDFERFSFLLDAHGADESRWPSGERAAMRHLIASSAQAQARLAALRALDRLLARETALEAPPPALAKKILAHAPEANLSPRAVVSLRHAAQGAALAASLLLGILAGATGFLGGAPAQEAEIIATLFPLDPGGIERQLPANF